MSKLNEWLSELDSRRDVAYSMIRIYLGLALMVRGILLLSDPARITELTGAHQFYWWYAYIIGAHLLGGLLLAIGFLTRLAAAAQLPVLIGAVLFLHLEQGLLTVGQSLELAVMVLFLLFVYFLFGAGHYALDNKYSVTRKIDGQADNR